MIMRPVLKVPMVMTAASVATDYRGTGSIPVNFGAENMQLHRDVDTNVACMPVYSNFALLESEPVYVGYSSDGALLRGIVEVRRKSLGEPTHGKKKTDDYVGLFRMFDAAALRYLFYTEDIGDALLHELRKRPDLFTMLRRTLTWLKLREGEPLEVKPVDYVDPIENVLWRMGQPISRERTLQQMPHLLGFEDISLRR